MANIFYYNSIVYTPLQLDPYPFYAPNQENSCIFLPIIQSPALLQFQGSSIAKHIPVTAEVQETDREVSSTLNSKKGRQADKKAGYRKQRSREKEQSQEFTVREVKVSPGVTYKKKNTESNIVNQTFSYLSSQRSKAMVNAFFNGNGSKVDEYYRLIDKIKQLNKKYINRKYLKRLTEFSTQTDFRKTFHKCQINYITLQNVEKLLRALTYHFLRQDSVLTLLTSSKIYKETLPEHFWRKRQIMSFLFDKHQSRDRKGASE